MGKRSRRLKRQKHNAEYLERMDLGWPVQYIQWESFEVPALNFKLLTLRPIIMNFDKLLSVMSPGVRVIIPTVGGL